MSNLYSMQTDKSFSSMIFVIIISAIGIITSIICLIKASLLIMAIAFIVFLTPIFLYFLTFLLKNYKRRKEFNNVEEDSLDSDFSAPSLNHSSSHETMSKKDKVDIFIETL
jgi:hypothetical protein